MNRALSCLCLAYIWKQKLRVCIPVTATLGVPNVSTKCTLSVLASEIFTNSKGKGLEMLWTGYFHDLIKLQIKNLQVAILSFLVCWVLSRKEEDWLLFPLTMTKKTHTQKKNAHKKQTNPLESQHLKSTITSNQVASCQPFERPSTPWKSKPVGNKEPLIFPR